MAKMSLREYANQWLKKKGIGNSEAKKQGKKYKSISAAKKAGALYYTDKNGKLQLAVHAEDLKKAPTSKRDSSPKPKLRPGSGKFDQMTQAEKDEVAAANKRSKIAREQKAGSTASVEAIAKGAGISRADSAKITYDQNRRISQEKRGDSPGQKFNAWYEKNGSKYDTMKEAMAAYKKTLKMSKGGMAKKSGYRAGGVVKANCGASMKPNRMSKR